MEYAFTRRSILPSAILWLSLSLFLCMFAMHKTTIAANRSGLSTTKCNKNIVLRSHRNNSWSVGWMSWNEMEIICVTHTSRNSTSISLIKLFADIRLGLRSSTCTLVDQRPTFEHKCKIKVTIITCIIYFSWEMIMGMKPI